ncbi:MAG: MBL fold metallo-hydrolase [Candidatus Magasanikbacteria bacterium]
MEGIDRKKIIIAIVLLLVVLATIFYFQNNKANNFNSVTYFDVGQGDSALIKFDNGQKMLVDCGINRNILSKLGSALSFFDRTIDYLVISHPDGDHYGGCPAVLQRYQVKNIITNGAQKTNDPFWKAWQKYSQLEQAQNKVISGHEILTIGASRIEFLAPDESLGADFNKAGGNNQSIVFLLKNNLGKYLFTGDMEILLEEALIKKYCAGAVYCPALQADFLKVGHHGSDSSSGDLFLQAVNPKFSVISVGQNSYGHPSLRTLRKLDREGSEIWRTDQKNDIIVK